MPHKDINKRREYARIWGKQRTIQHKEIALSLVGSSCKRCGLDDKRVLEFDHIKPILRRTSGIHSGHNLARDIATSKVNYKLFQTLCSNCHTIKTYYPDEF